MSYDNLHKVRSRMCPAGGKDEGQLREQWARSQCVLLHVPEQLHRPSHPKSGPPEGSLHGQVEGGGVPPEFNG